MKKKDITGPGLSSSNFSPKPPGFGYPMGSRDFWDVELDCFAYDCVANSGRGKCCSPALAKIGPGGKCKGYKKSTNKTKKHKRGK